MPILLSDSALLAHQPLHLPCEESLGWIQGYCFVSRRGSDFYPFPHLPISNHQAGPEDLMELHTTVLKKRLFWMMNSMN